MLRWSCTVACVAMLVGIAVAEAAQKPQVRPSPSPSPKKRAVPRFPAIPLFGAHVHESLAYRPVDERGRVRRDAARSLERLLRCRQTGARHRLHPRLGDALYQIGRHFPGHRLEIFSGYRPRAYCTRAHSRHMSGSAVDFHVEGIDNATLIAFLKKRFHPAGVGSYPRGVHVHLDLERRVDTYWVDPGPPVADPQLVDAATDPEELEAENVEPLELPRPPNEVALPEPPSIDPSIDDDPPTAEDREMSGR